MLCSETTPYSPSSPYTASKAGSDHLACAYHHTPGLLASVTYRLGHDFRYAIDSSLIESELGWQVAETFETDIRKTVDWNVSNSEHWSRSG